MIDELPKIKRPAPIPSLEPTTVPEEPKKPQKTPGTYFCESCLHARDDPQYFKRITALLQPLFCSGCGRDHARIFFSPSQRFLPDTERICIGRQGHRTACPHFKFTFDDVNHWFDEYTDGLGTFKISCDEMAHCGVVGLDHSSCPFQNAYVEGFDVTMLSLNIFWTAQVEGGYIATKWDRVKSKIRSLYRTCPEAFGPCLGINPQTLFDFQSLEQQDAQSKNTKTTSNVTMSYRLADDCDDNQPFAAPITCMSLASFHHDNPCSTQWVDMLDLNSYEAFLNNDTHSITWCHDHGCITTYDQVRSSALTWLAGREEGASKNLLFASDTSDLSLRMLEEDTWASLKAKGKGNLKHLFIGIK